MKAVITGRPGVGKTTLVKRIVVAVKGVIPVGGFYTEEVREKGKRIGFVIVTISGKRGWLARVGNGYPRVGRYHVFTEAMENLALPEVEHALSTDGLLIVDEIGPMELLCERFAKMVPEIANHKNFVVTVQLKLKNMLSFFKSGGAEIITLSAGNRDKVAESLISRLLSER